MKNGTTIHLLTSDWERIAALRKGPGEPLYSVVTRVLDRYESKAETPPVKRSHIRSTAPEPPKDEVKWKRQGILGFLDR